MVDELKVVLLKRWQNARGPSLRNSLLHKLAVVMVTGL